MLGLYHTFLTSFGEQGHEFIVKHLQEAFPDDPSLSELIQPLDRNTFIRYVLAVEVTTEIIRRREDMSHVDASRTAFQSAVWGGVYLPEFSGTEGEDVEAEHSRMVQEQSKCLICENMARQWSKKKRTR